MKQYDTEYSGKTHENTLPAKTRGMVLTSSEKLRLLYLTGQMDDPTEPPSRRPFEGLDPKKQLRGFKELYPPER